MEHNHRAIVNAVREGTALSRIDLSRSSNLSLATAKRVVDELLERGMLEEGEALRGPGRGRKASALRLGSRYGFSVGADVQPDSLRLTGLAFDGTVIYRRELSPDTDDRDSLQGLLVAELRRALADSSAASRGSLLGIGVGIAGLVDAREGVVLYCPGLPGWENAPLASTLGECFGVEVLVDDAVRCMALAEKRHGAARGLGTFLYLYIGSGVGSGIVLDNRIYRGTNGVSGEFGHITVKEDGPLCTCGNKGCLEAVVSARAILERARELVAAGVHSTLGADTAGSPDQALSLEGIYQAALRGDKLATMLVAEAEESIGIGVADLINIFDPGTVVLAGEVIETFHGLILEGIQKIVRRRALHVISQRTVIMKGAFETNIASLGAATLVIEQILGNEVLNL
jgi:predicted NBD/HSP70 family sugar kinase